MRRALAASLLGACLGACIHRPPLVRLAARTPITLVVVRDGKEGARLDREPRALAEALDRELDRRNLYPERLSPEAIAPLARTHDTKARAGMLATALGPGKECLLVELKTTYFDYMEGRHKWVVETRLLVARTDRLDVAATADFDISVFLPYDFEGPKEAQEQAAEEIAERLGRLLDNHFAGQPEATPEAAPASAAQGSADWTARPLYFVLLDRFAPSEALARAPPAPAGSAPSPPRREAAPELAPTDPAGWHGGDLATLRRHLGDLQALGVGAVWLSPVASCLEDKRGAWGAYHCYWTLDPAAFERRFGTAAELRRLRDELHARGMRLVLDVVLNHVAPGSRLLAEHPGWFHPDRPLLDYRNPEEVEQGWLSGLPDFAQEKPAVADYLIRTVSAWVRAVEPDGLRLDAVKHVPVSFWRRFTGALHALRPGLEIVGEDLDGDAAQLVAEARAGGFDALFDFPLRAAILGAACEGAPVGAVAARFGLDRLDAPGTAWATLLDNHDLPRLATACADFDHAAAALDLLFLSRGIPTLTYGVEAGLPGKGDPDNRGDLELPVRSSWRDLLARLASLRASHPALADGRTFVASASRGGFLMYRAAPDGSELAAIAVARGERARRPRGGRWTRLLSEQRADLIFTVDVSSDPQDRDQLAHETAPAAPRKVRFEVEGLPSLQPGDSIAVVGAAPELGAWNPARGAPLSVRLPANEAYELKLVVRRSNGQVEWEPGPNEIVDVEGGEGPETFTLHWLDRARRS